MEPKSTSAITFLYVSQMEEAKLFFSDFLELELVYDPGWAAVWRMAGTAFVGAVVKAHGSNPPHGSGGGVLVSLTVPELEPIRQRLVLNGGYRVSPIREVRGIPLRSFFLKGLEGYDFEIQQFTDPELKELF